MLVSPPVRTITDTLTWRILAALPFLGMLAFSLFDYSDSRTFDPWMWGFTIFFGALFAFSLYWGATRKVTIHQEGIAYRSPFKNSEMRWEEVVQTRYGQTPINAGGAGGLLGVLIVALVSRGGGGAMNKTLIIEGPTKIKLTSNMKDVDEAIKLILDAVNPRLLKLAENNLSSGMPVEFGQLSLTIQGAVWKKKSPIPFTSIVKCMVDGKNFQLKSEGKWLNDVSVTADKIPNVFIAIQMIEARRVTIGSAPVSKGMSAGFGS